MGGFHESAPGNRLPHTLPRYFGNKCFVSESSLDIENHPGDAGPVHITGGLSVKFLPSS